MNIRKVRELLEYTNKEISEWLKFKNYLETELKKLEKQENKKHE